MTRIDISGDTNYLVSSGQDGEVNFWDTKVLDRFCQFSVNILTLTFVYFQDGSHVKSYEGAGRVMLALWNFKNDKV